MERWVNAWVTFWALFGGRRISGIFLRGEIRSGVRGLLPLLEFFAVGFCFNVADHEVGQVAVFVGDDVEEAV